MRLPYLLLPVLAVTLVDGGFNCPSESPINLYHADPTNKCKYFQCDESGVASERTCADGTKWSDKDQTCVSLENGESCSVFPQGSAANQLAETQTSTAERDPYQTAQPTELTDTSVPLTTSEKQPTHAPQPQDTVGTSETRVCPTDFLLYGEKCYHYVSEGHDWTQAFFHCLSLRGYLAEPKSASEYQYLNTLIKDNGEPRDVYIGGKRINGEWTWVRTNEVIDYLPWSPPNPSGEGECMSLWRARDYGLDDYGCGFSSTPSVCEAAPGPKKAASDASAPQCQTFVTSALLGLIVAFM